MRYPVRAGALLLTLIAARLAPAQVNIPRTPMPGESHLANIRQLTEEGTQAEAYFSHDGKWMIWTAQRGTDDTGGGKPSSQVWAAIARGRAAWSRDDRSETR